MNTLPPTPPEDPLVRRLEHTDFSPRSRLREATRARLLARHHEQNRPARFWKPGRSGSTPMNTRLSNLSRAFAFGAAMILLVLALAWALTNTTPQPAANPTETALIATPSNTLPDESLTLAPSPTPIPAHAPTVGDPPTVLQTLTAKHADTLLSGAGWMHLSYNIYGPSSRLPNGAIIPQEFVWEFWYLLDEQSQVIQEIALMQTLEGEPIQISVTKDGLSRNLTFGFEGAVEPFTPDLDYGFAERASSILSGGDSLTTTITGTLTMGDLFFEGQFVGVLFNLRVGEVEWEAIFNPDTGEMLGLTEYRLSGSPPAKAIFSHFTPITEERVEQPPAEVLAYLDMESVPYTVVPPSGEPPPGNFNPALSFLTFRWISGDDPSTPSFFYGDIYADNYLLGRVDFGEIPGGWCDRSWNGGLIAFNYQKDGLATLRWFSLKDVTLSRGLPGYDLHSPVTFAPNDFRVAFAACKQGECGLYVFDLAQGGVDRIGDGGTVAQPVWSPDGQYIAIRLVSDENDGSIPQVQVIRVETGEVIYLGDANGPGSPLTGWRVNLPEGITSTGRCEYPPGGATPTAERTPTPPAPGSFDPAQSDLAFQWTFTGNADEPNAVADIYAGDQYLGPVDFGATSAGVEPGGMCTRSADGKLIAFAYSYDKLRWFSLDNGEQVHELPDMWVSSFAFSPISNQLVVTGCGGMGCGIWRFDPLTDELYKLHPEGGYFGFPPMWSPDGESFAFIPWRTEDEGEPGTIPNTIIVMQVDNGEIIYEGYAYASESPLIKWKLTLSDLSVMPGTTGCESAP